MKRKFNIWGALLLACGLFMFGCRNESYIGKSELANPPAKTSAPPKTEETKSEPTDQSAESESVRNETEEITPTQDTDSDSNHEKNNAKEPDERQSDKNAEEFFIKQKIRQLEQAEKLFDGDKLEKAYAQALQVWMECDQNKTPDESKQKIQQNAENLLKRISAKQTGQNKWDDDSKTLVITVE
ncbi:MAG: hypothetical protein LBT05_03445 [Planctomycetaceae bacterium]|jgi:hypothetical protein|nr:hypothetical protein [Planctomycetaceae bacterium]